MSLSDPIADMLTRVRNATRIGKTDVRIKASKVCQGIADVLKSEGYIVGYDKIDDGTQGIIKIDLKYSDTGISVINDIKRVSKPGRRMYTTVADMPKVLGGLGVAIVSTSKGVMSDKNCRNENIGGELLCTVS